MLQSCHLIANYFDGCIWLQNFNYLNLLFKFRHFTACLGCDQACFIHQEYLNRKLFKQNKKFGLVDHKQKTCKITLP